jgi:hypothetical protein
VYPLVVTSSDRERGKRERAFDHVAHYATIERQAYVPTLFAYEGEQPLRIRNPRPFATPLHEDRGAWLRVLEHYDYVWTYGVDAETRRLLAERCAPVESSDGFTLWRVTGTARSIGRVTGVVARVREEAR